MKNLFRLGALAAAMTLAMFAFDATAQVVAKKAEAKPKSACNALADEVACKAGTDCQWIKASVDAKTGKVKRKAYCRIKSKPPVKKATEPARK